MCIRDRPVTAMHFTLATREIEFQVVYIIIHAQDHDRWQTVDRLLVCINKEEIWCRKQSDFCHDCSADVMTTDSESYNIFLENRG